MRGEKGRNKALCLNRQKEVKREDRQTHKERGEKEKAVERKKKPQKERKQVDRKKERKKERIKERKGKQGH